MKKVKLLLATSLIAVALAGCGQKGGSTSAPTTSAETPSSSAASSSSTPAPSSSSTTSSEPAPSKTDWTQDEKDLMKATLEYDLPFAHGLTIDTDVDTAVVAVGDAVEAADVEAYAAEFEELDFVEETISYDTKGKALNLGDVYEIADFAEDPYFYRINSQQAGYYPVYGQVVAVGQDEDGKLLVVTTEWAAGFENQVSVDYGAYGINTTYPLSGYYEMFTSSAIYATCDSKATQAQVDAWCALFGTFESADADMIGVDDYQYEFPFTYGNIYSDKYQATQDMVIRGVTEAECTTYTDALVTAGYTEIPQTGYSIYRLVDTTNGIAIIILVYYSDAMFGPEKCGAEVMFSVTWLSE